MLCALCGSALWVNNATRLGLAVSTSHSIVGATIGVGIAFRGTGTVLWGSATTGVGASACNRGGGRAALVAPHFNLIL